MYAIIKTGGKQYRVQEGESLLVERLPGADGETIALQPLLFVDGTDVIDGDGLSAVTIQARIVGHERGPKLRIVKFKPKRGYKRRTGHRQELTRIEVTSLGKGGRRRSGGSKAKSPAPVAAAKAPEPQAAAPEVEAAAPEVEAAAPEVEAAAPEVEAAAPEVEAAASETEAPATKPAAKRGSAGGRQSSKPEASDGS